jgi:hypothetical protein
VSDAEHDAASHPVLTRAHERLREELDDDRITLPGPRQHVDLLLTELEHARRPPIHEGRSAQYGSIVLPAAGPLDGVADLVEVIDLDLPIEQCRLFADGRSSYLVRRQHGPTQLACFRRSVQFEADLVEVELATGATIVQRTLMGVPRLFTPTGVVEWNGRHWRMRPSAREYLPRVERAVPEAPRAVLAGLLDLASHWLSPSRIGATFLLDLDPRPHDDHGQDHSAALPAPALSVTTRAHYPAIYSVLSQTDLATLVSVDGSVTRFGVGLRSSEESEAAVRLDAGMRHRSAARYTWDHHHTVAFVVSEDGPVQLGAVFLGILEEVLGSTDLDDLTLGHEHDAVGDLAGESHLVGDDDHGHAGGGELLHRVEHFADHLGIERGGRLVEEHHLRLHGQRAGDRDALLLTARQLPGVLARLFGDLDVGEHRHPEFLGLRLGHLAHLARRQRDVVEHAEVREQVEALEHHARLATDLLDVADVVRQLGAVDDDTSGVVFLEPVDAPDHRRLARTRGADDDDDLLGCHAQVDVAQRLEVVEELVDVLEFDDHVTVAGDLGGVLEVDALALRTHRVPTPNFFSSR